MLLGVFLKRIFQGSEWVHGDENYSSECLAFIESLSFIVLVDNFDICLNLYLL